MGVKDEYKHRIRWGSPIPIDTTLLLAADDIFPDSPLFDNDEINIAWSQDWDDRDHLSAEWFTLFFTHRNQRAIYQSGDQEFIPITESFYTYCQPTIGEMVYVVTRYVGALYTIYLPYGDKIPPFVVTLEKSRQYFPEYEALAWALLHHTVSDDIFSSTFDKGIGQLSGTGIDFDAVANLVNKGITAPVSIRKAVEHDIDPRLLGSTVLL